MEQLSQMRREAVEQGQWELAKHYHIKSVRMRSRALYFNPDVAAQAMDAWEREYALNPVMHRVVNQQAKQIQVWGHLGHIIAPTLVVYGYRDFEPITQAYRLKEEMPNVTIQLVNEAGHEVWLEQAEWLKQEDSAALSRGGGGVDDNATITPSRFSSLPLTPYQSKEGLPILCKP